MKFGDWLRGQVYRNGWGCEPLWGNMTVSITQRFILNILPQMVFPDHIPGLTLGKPLWFRSKNGLLQGPDFLQNGMSFGESEHIALTSGGLAQLFEDTTPEQRGSSYSEVSPLRTRKGQGQGLLSLHPLSRRAELLNGNDSLYNSTSYSWRDSHKIQHS